MRSDENGYNIALLLSTKQRNEQKAILPLAHHG